MNNRKQSRRHWVAWITRAPASRWPDRGCWRARLRRWWLHTVKRDPGEDCDHCGRSVSTVYWAPDDRWPIAYARAMGYAPLLRPWGTYSGLLCEPCFDRHRKP